jgi:hypothetical protein
MNILNMWLINKYMQKINFFNVKWYFKDKNLQQSRHLKLWKIKNIYIRKFQWNSLINYSFDVALFFYFYFDTTLIYFLIPHFYFFCVIDIMLSFQKFIIWVHNFFTIHPKFLWWFPLKFMTTWIIKKLTMLMTHSQAPW